MAEHIPPAPNWPAPTPPVQNEQSRPLPDVAQRLMQHLAEHGILLAANEQKFKFDPLFLRLFFRESYPFTTEKVYLSQIPGLVNMALYVSPIVSGEVIR
ncbi:EspF repeat-containing protein, partial [Escherichia coli]|uniref:EspF repeat-containing protein n=1 Tax=Escherichia coli TaxID=562 RepID=UPI002023A4C3